MKNKQFTYYLPAKVDRDLNHVAKRFKTTKGALIVKALQEYIFSALPGDFFDDVKLSSDDLDKLIKNKGRKGK